MRRVWIFLLIAFVYLSTDYWLSSPRTRDISIYAVVAHGLLDGKLPYLDLWDHKPPPIYLALAFCELLAGRGEAEIFLLSFICTTFSLLGIVKLFEGLNLKSWFSAALAISFIYYTTNPRFDGAEPNLEALINPLLIWGLVRLQTNHKDRFIPALLFATAIWVKQVALFPVLLIYVALQIKDKTAWKGAAMAFLCTAALWGGTFFFYYLQGGVNEAWEALVSYNYDYMATTGSSAAPRLQIPLLALYLLGAFGLLAGLASKNRISYMLFFAYLLGSICAAFATRRYYLHYFQLILPGLLLCIGIIPSLVQNLKSKIAIKLAIVLFIICLTIYNDSWFYKYTPTELANLRSKRYHTMKDLGISIKTTLNDGETFFQWGADPSLYYYSEKNPPTRFFYSYPLTESSLSEKYVAELIKDLEHKKPKVILIDPEQVNRGVAASKFLEFVNTNYIQTTELLANKFLAVFVRREG